MLSQAELRAIVRLNHKKYRQESSLFLAEGGRLCEEAVNSDWKIKHVLYCRSLLNSMRARQAVMQAKERGLAVAEIPLKVFANISDTKSSQGVVAVIEKHAPAVKPLDHLRESPRSSWVAIEKLHDPGNLGTILRTADWFGVDGIVTGSMCVEVFNPKTVRASMGAIFRLSMYEEPDFVELMKRFQMFGAVLYGADQAGDFPYTTLKFAPKRVLLIGDEIEGLSAELKKIVHHRVSIPRRGGGESLNVSIAAAILLAEMMR